MSTYRQNGWQRPEWRSYDRSDYFANGYDLHSDDGLRYWQTKDYRDSFPERRSYWRRKNFSLIFWTVVFTTLLEAVMLLVWIIFHI